MSIKNLLLSIPVAALITACGGGSSEKDKNQSSADSLAKTEIENPFQYQAEQFADIRVLRYQVPGFNELSVQQKTLLYYLSEAALCGRDIMWDQHYKYNLTIRKTLENIIESYNGDQTTPEYAKFMVYTKRVWFSNGIHHHYSTDKLIPEFSSDYFAALIKGSNAGNFPVNTNETPEQFTARLTPILFNPKIDAKRVNLDAKVDMVKNSAINFYEGVTQKEAEAFYKAVNKNTDTMPVMAGLNSKLVKENGKLVEMVWKVGGMYSPAIEIIVYWLEKASGVAENAAQKDALDKLVVFYKSGSLKDFDTYSIAWAKDTESAIDVVNGFIEVYRVSSVTKNINNIIP